MEAGRAVDLGYALRHLVASPLCPERRAWAFAVYASVAAGVARAEHESHGIPSRSPVVGARFGADAYLHVGRFFLGWGLDLRLLRHTRGALRRSAMLSWNVIPLARFGVDLGPRAQDLAR